MIHNLEQDVLQMRTRGFIWHTERERITLLKGILTGWMMDAFKLRGEQEFWVITAALISNNPLDFQVKRLFV